MEEDRTLYLCTCKDRNCTGRTVIESSPQVPTDAGLAHEVSDCPPCPVCGREMKMVPMASEGIEFLPEPARPDALSQTIRSRTLFRTTTNENNGADSPDQEQEGKTDTEFLTERDVAKILGISTTAVRRLVSEKKLGFIQLTKRKKAFTQALIDEFIRRESGSSVRPITGSKSPLLPKPAESGISIEESREILRKVLKKPSNS